MTNLITSFLIACGTFLITDYLPSLLRSLKWGKILHVIDRKPFSCPMCLSIWLTIIYSITFDIEFIVYLGVVPILTEGISRHLLEVRL